MKKKIDSLLSLYRQTEEANGLINELNPKWAALQARLEEMNKYHWLTGENILKRKKVKLKSTFSCLMPEKRFDQNFPISSLNISYIGEGNANSEGNGLTGIYLALHLKTKTGSQVDIGIACNDGCVELPMLSFDKLRRKMLWETCTIHFIPDKNLEIVIDFCEQAVKEVNEKLSSANLEPMEKRFHIIS